MRNNLQMCFKKKIFFQRSKSEALVGFIQQFMSQAASHLAPWMLQGEVTQWKVFRERQKEGVCKRKEQVILGQGIFFTGRGLCQFYHTYCCFFLLQGDREGAKGPHYLIGADQKVPDWVIPFLVKVDSTVTLGTKSGCDSMGFSTNDAILV